MSDPFLGEVKIVSFNFPPKGWAYCNGQLLPINQNQALFALFGTTYGGNGQTNFALPNLRGRVPMHMGGGFTQGEAAGQSAVTVTQAQMPAHNHFLTFSNLAGTTNAATPTVVPAKTGTNAYGPIQNLVAMGSDAITSIGGSQPHNNQQPYLVLNLIVALQGIFPSQN